MKETTPLERALFLLERFQREVSLMQAELSAHLPADDSPARDWIADPLTGKKRYIKKGNE